MWSLAERRREESANQEHWRIWSKATIDLAGFCAQMAADATPHFYALSRGKQTEPCSAGTWLVVPPLLWVIWRAVSTRGMESALTGVDFEHLPEDDLELNFSQRLFSMSEQPIKNVWHRTKGCIMFYISASSLSFQRWLPEWCDTHVSM